MQACFCVGVTEAGGNSRCCLDQYELPLFFASIRPPPPLSLKVRLCSCICHGVRRTNVRFFLFTFSRHTKYVKIKYYNHKNEKKSLFLMNVNVLYGLKLEMRRKKFRLSAHPVSGHNSFWSYPIRTKFAGCLLCTICNSGIWNPI